MTRSFRRYLEAKRTVDDRALNHRVLRYVADGIRSCDGPLRVLELGAGVGTMIPRILALDGGPAEVRYTAVDNDGDLLAVVPAILEGYPAIGELVEDGSVVEVTHAGGTSARVERVTADAGISIDRSRHPYDLVVAAGFMDLVEAEDLVPKILACLAPGGLAYFPITFDGSTALEPPIESAFDERILDQYHASMRVQGTDRAGRALLRVLHGADAATGLAAGGSDWVVVPDRGGYPADEAYFLEYLIGTIDRELTGHPDLDDDRFAAWIDERHAQIRAGELALVAHNLDVVAERRSTG